MTEPTEQPTKIVEVKMSCTSCKWMGRVADCGCDADYQEFDDDGRLRCPECKGLVNEITEQPNLRIVKTIQQRMHVITKELESLPDSPLRRMALDDIGIFEAGILYKLQEEYE